MKKIALYLGLYSSLSFCIDDVANRSLELKIAQEIVSQDEYGRIIRNHSNEKIFTFSAGTKLIDVEKSIDEWLLTVGTNKESQLLYCDFKVGENPDQRKTEADDAHTQTISQPYAKFGAFLYLKLAECGFNLKRDNF